MASLAYGSFGLAEQITNQKYIAIWERVEKYGLTDSTLSELCAPLLTDLGEPNPDSPTIKGRDFVYLKGDTKQEFTSVGDYAALPNDE